VESLSGGDEPGLDGRHLVAAEAFLDGGLESPDGGIRRLKAARPFARQLDLEDASVSGVGVTLDQSFAFQRREQAVDRLRGDVHAPGEIGARRAGVAGEHAQQTVLRGGEAVRAKGSLHRAVKAALRLAQEEAAVPLDAAVALTDHRNAHATQDIRALTRYKGLVILRGMSTVELEQRCDLLRSLHVPGDPIVLPNAWDVSTAKAIEAAGFPAVATTSAGVAASLGYEDHQHAPRDEMMAAAARVCRGVDVPVTVDAEGGYGMEPAELVAALMDMGAAGCNLEDTNHATGQLRDPAEHASWLRLVREAARDAGYGLVVNARIDVFVNVLASGSDAKQGELVPEALRRARAYIDAGADSIFPILLWEADPVRAFTADAPGPVNILAIPPAPSIAELAELGVARVSYGGRLHHQLMEQFGGVLGSLAADRERP